MNTTQVISKECARLADQAVKREMLREAKRFTNKKELFEYLLRKFCKEEGILLNKKSNINNII